jgi:acyl carrier protein
MSDDLNLRLKKLIIETLRLKDTRPEDIADDAPMLGGGLELDSLDALEVVVVVEKTFGVKIDSSEDSKRALSSVNELAAFVREKSDKV